MTTWLQVVSNSDDSFSCLAKYWSVSDRQTKTELLQEYSFVFGRTIIIIYVNKKAVLPQGNRAMPQVFFSGEVRQQHSLQVIRLAKLRKRPRFRAPNMLAQNAI